MSRVRIRARDGGAESRPEAVLTIPELAHRVLAGREFSVEDEWRWEDAADSPWQPLSRHVELAERLLTDAVERCVAHDAAPTRADSELLASLAHARRFAAAKDQYVFDALGGLLLQLADPVRALEHFALAVRVCPVDERGVLHNNMGVLKARLGDAAAETEFATATRCYTDAIPYLNLVVLWDYLHAQGLASLYLRSATAQLELGHGERGCLAVRGGDLERAAAQVEPFAQRLATPRLVTSDGERPAMVAFRGHIWDGRLALRTEQIAMNFGRQLGLLEREKGAFLEKLGRGQRDAENGQYAAAEREYGEAQAFLRESEVLQAGEAEAWRLEQEAELGGRLRTCAAWRRSIDRTVRLLESDGGSNSADPTALAGRRSSAEARRLAEQALGETDPEQALYLVEVASQLDPDLSDERRGAWILETVRGLLANKLVEARRLDRAGEFPAAAAALRACILLARRCHHGSLEVRCQCLLDMLEWRQRERELQDTVAQAESVDALRATLSELQGVATRALSGALPGRIDALLAEVRRREAELMLRAAEQQGARGDLAAANATLLELHERTALVGPVAGFDVGERIRRLNLKLEQDVLVARTTEWTRRLREQPEALVAVCAEAAALFEALVNEEPKTRARDVLVAAARAQVRRIDDDEAREVAEAAVDSLAGAPRRSPGREPGPARVRRFAVCRADAWTLALRGKRQAAAVAFEEALGAEDAGCDGALAATAGAASRILRSDWWWWKRRRALKRLSSLDREFERERAAGRGFAESRQQCAAFERRYPEVGGGLGRALFGAGGAA